MRALPDDKPYGRTPAPLTRQIVLPTSSATSSAPLVSIATPTGRPRASPPSLTKPGSTSLGSPAADEAGAHGEGLAGGPAGGKGDEDHLVTAPRPAIPRAMLADEHPTIE